MVLSRLWGREGIIKVIPRKEASGKNILKIT